MFIYVNKNDIIKLDNIFRILVIMKFTIKYSLIKFIINFSVKFDWQTSKLKSLKREIWVSCKKTKS